MTKKKSVKLKKKKKIQKKRLLCKKQLSVFSFLHIYLNTLIVFIAFASPRSDYIDPDVC